MVYYSIDEQGVVELATLSPPVAILRRLTQITKSDTDGEAIFVIASMLKHQLFNRSSDKNHAYFRLRHQYQKCTSQNALKL